MRSWFDDSGVPECTNKDYSIGCDRSLNTSLELHLALTSDILAAIFMN
jgi:hypothetical protein